VHQRHLEYLKHRGNHLGRPYLPPKPPPSLYKHTNTHNGGRESNLRPLLRGDGRGERDDLQRHGSGVRDRQVRDRYRRHVRDAARAHHEVYYPRRHGGYLGHLRRVVAVLIAGKLSSTGYTLFQGFLHLGAGLAVGLSALAAGYAIGIVGDAGVRGTAQQPRLFVGMILILIFAEVLGLYGLIVAIFLFTKNG